MGDDNRVDWTLSDAPPADEQPDSAASPPPVKPARPPPSQRDWPPRRLPRRAGLVLGVVAVVAVLATAALPVWETWQTRQAVAGVIAQQEQARLAGAWATLRTTYAASPTVWATNQIVPLSNGVFPAPMDLPGLRPLSVAGHSGQFQVLGPGLVHVDVIRPVMLADSVKGQLRLAPVLPIHGRDLAAGRAAGD